jgi:uncharacterized protein (DUF1778 family)
VEVRVNAAQQEKTARLQLRASEQQRSLLAAASKAEGTTVTDFVLRHATRAAENVLADRRLFLLSDERWEAFNALLDRPEQDLPQLQKLLKDPTVLDD